MKRKAAMMAIAMAMTVSTIFTESASILTVYAEESVDVETQSEDGGSGDSGSSDAGDGGNSDTGDGGSSDAGDGGSSDAGDGGSSNTGDSGSSDAGDGGNSDTGDGGSSDAGDGGSSDAGDGGSSNTGDSGSSDAGDGGSSDTGNTGSESSNTGSSNSQKNEADKTIGDILDELFGQNKPKPNPNAGGTTGGGMTEEEIRESEIRGNRPTGYIDESGNYYKYQYKEDGSWYLEGLGISGTGNPTIEDITAGLAGNTGTSGNTGNTGNSGSSVNINPIAPGTTVTTSNNDGSVTTLKGNTDGTVTVTTVKVDGTISEVTIPGSSFVTPGVLPTGVTTFVPVMDEAMLEDFPEAMIVTAPSGVSFVHALNPERTIYSVWSAGYQVDAFLIKDSNGAFVPMLDATIIVTADNKAYVNVTLPDNIKGAEVYAAQEQRVGFVKHYGINGVMINGELAEEFVIPETTEAG